MNGLNTTNGTNQGGTNVDQDLYDDVHGPASSGFGKYFVLAVLIVGGIFAVRRFTGLSGAMAGWTQDYDKALADSASSGKPMMVLFTADWCPPCRTLKSDVFSDSKVSSYLQKEFTLCKVDLTDRGGPNNQTAQTFGVRGIPTLIVFDAKGNQVDRMSGAPPKEYLMQWFQAVGAKAKR